MYFPARALVLVSATLVVVAGVPSLAAHGQRATHGRIAFTDGALYVVGSNGTGQRRLTRGSPDFVDVYPRWSPDGSMLAFAREGSDPSSQAIYVIGSDGRGMRRVASPGTRLGATYVLPSGENAPEWSPDGKTLAFARLLDGVFTVGLAGSTERRLTPQPRPGDNYTEPSWSPDGRRIVFVKVRYTASLDPVDGGIYVVNADGSGLRRLTRNPTDSEPAWSPDGRTLLFVRGVASDIYSMKSNGAGVARLTKNPYDDLSPAWSPDNSKIAYTCKRAVGPYADVCVMNAHGGQAKRFSSTRPWNSSPAWSPDGRWIAFASERNYELDLRVIGVDGKGVRKIAPSASGDTPSWQPSD